MSAHKFAIIGLPYCADRTLPPEAYHTRAEYEAVLAERARLNAPAKPDMNSAQIFESHLRRLAASDPAAVASWRERFAADWTGTLAAIRRLHGVRGA